MRRAATWRLAGAVVLLALAAPVARAADVERTAWYWATATPLPPPFVPSDGLYVEGRPDGPAAVAAVRLTLDADERDPVLTLRVAEGAGLQGAVVLACAADAGWVSGSAQRWEARPVHDCADSVPGQVDTEGTQVAFSLERLRRGPVLDLVVAPGTVAALPPGANGSTFAVAFDKPTREAITTQRDMPPPPPPPSSPPGGDGGTVMEPPPPSSAEPVPFPTPVPPPPLVEPAAPTTTVVAPADAPVGRPVPASRSGSARFSVVFLGLAIGMIYGLLAVGLVLVHRSSRVVNFAHANVGVVAAAAFAVAVARWGVPYYVALPPALGLGAATSLLTYVTVIRRLDKSPAVMKVIATIGVGSFLQLMAVVVNGRISSGTLFPQPPWFPTFFIGPLQVTRAYSAMLVGGPLVVAGLALFLRNSRVGIAIRGAAANPEAARLAAISASSMTGLSWAIAGALAALTAILVLPTQGVVSAQEVFGPQLLLRALAAGVIARMERLPVALLAGLAIGVVEQQLLFDADSAGVVDVALFAMLIVALLLQRRRTGGRHADDGTQWLTVQPWRGPSSPGLGRAVALAALAVAAVLPVVVSNSTAVVLVAILAYGTVGLSVGLISGLAGQVSLGHFAVAATGAVVSWHVVDLTANFAVGLPAAALAGAAVALLLGMPAVRIKGLMFAVATLAFAQASPWFLEHDWLLGRGRISARPVIAGFSFDATKRYYYFVLFCCAVCLVVAHRVWHTGVGRRYRAVRDNEANARAFGVPTTRVLLEAFAVSGALAGVGGALYGHSLSAVSAEAFPLAASVSIVAMAALGGVGLLVGPLLGALYIVGVPRWVPLDDAGLAATSLGWLLVILFNPGGLAQAVAPLRERLLSGRSSASGSATASASTAPDDTVVAAPRLAAAGRNRAAGEVVLEVEGLSKSYGGVHAVRDVSLLVREGETVGLIGANGAGKTTLFELVGGFARPDTGRVVFDGRDITRMDADARARLGLVRSFQDARLFATLTVAETLQVALERSLPTRPALEVAGWSRRERARRARADEVLELMGLTGYAHTQIAELSTGTRRVVELGCALALEPRVLLLDEPAAGIAQRETEALAELLMQLRDHLDVTMVVIEHDIPLVRSIADRIVAMGAGEVIADGDPASVLADPAVVEAYLGTDQAAVERSGARRRVAAR